MAGVSGEMGEMGARLKPLHRTKAAEGFFWGGVYDFDALWR